MDFSPKRKYRCTFIHTPDPAYARNQSYGLEFMPIWIYTLAAHIPDSTDIELDFYDTRFDEVRNIMEADFFVFSGINQDLQQLLAVRTAVTEKHPGAVTMVGGPICWSFNESGDLDLLGEFDHIVVGDGEDIFGGLITDLMSGSPLPHLTVQKERFNLSQARPYYRPFLFDKINRYYGVVIEVSRGCPFLCEFCDIRIIPDNNRAHTKPVTTIIEEMEYFIGMGKTQFIFACDNLIGDMAWAEELLDAIIEMVERTSVQPNLYTWLTINLAKMPHLLKKMRLAGFDLLFIGIESFNVNTLVETAKVQNTKRALIEDIKTIQSYGFIIIAGLIFGFDTEGEDCFEVALEGMNASGLLSGDPNFLTALPGTPLYRRVKLAGRLRDTSDLSSSSSTGGIKYISNIRYILPREKLISGFQYFVKQYNEGSFQLARLKSYFRNVAEKGNYIPLQKGNGGFADLKDLLVVLFKDRKGIKQLFRRLASFVRNPVNLFYLALGFYHVLFKVRIDGKFNQFRYWVFSWSNYLMKYDNVLESEFDIESVGDDFDLEQLIPEGYAETATEEIPANKIKAQVQSTIKGLRTFIEQAKNQ